MTEHIDSKDDKIKKEESNSEFGNSIGSEEQGQETPSQIQSNLTKCPRGRNIAEILKENPHLHQKRLKNLREKLKGNLYNFRYGFNSSKDAKSKLRKRLWDSFPDVVPRQHKVTNPLLEEMYRMLREHFCNSRMAEMQGLATTEVSKYQRRYSEFLHKYFEDCRQCGDAVIDEGDQKRILTMEQNHLLKTQLKEKGIPEDKIKEFAKFMIQKNQEGKTDEEALKELPPELWEVAELICE